MMASEGICKGFFSGDNFDNRIFAHLSCVLDPVRTWLSVLLSLHCWASSASLVLAAKNYSSSSVLVVHLPRSLFWMQGPFRGQLHLPTLLLSACPSSFQPQWYQLGLCFQVRTQASVSAFLTASTWCGLSIDIWALASIHSTRLVNLNGRVQIPASANFKHCFLTSKLGMIIFNSRGCL